MIDVIILLGGGTDGTLTPILYTKERLFAFAKIYKKYRGVPIIVSGGYSTWMKFIPAHREADVMRYFLIAHDIPGRSIFVERKSRDTIGNAFFSKQIIKKFSKWEKILIVTTKGHGDRSSWIFKKIFGKKYTISFFEVPTKFSSFHKNSGRKKYEQYLKHLMAKVFFSKIKDGDDVAVAKLLKKYHPAYSRSKAAQHLAKEITQAKFNYLGYTELR